MYRPDSPLLRRALKRDKFVFGDTGQMDGLVNYALHLPLLSFSADETCSLIAENEDRMIADEERHEPIFDEFVLHYKQPIVISDKPSWENNPLYEGVQAEVWTAFFNHDNPALMKALNGYPDPEKFNYVNDFYDGTNGKFDESSTKFVYSFLCYKDEKPVHVWAGWTCRTMCAHYMSILPTEGTEEQMGRLGITDMQNNGLTQHIQNTLAFERVVCNHAKYGEKHMVEVVPSKPRPHVKTPLNAKKPWKSATGPHILFLDRMPTTPAEGGVAQGGTKSPHRRRGHWRTLEHPRFRHHPQYGKKIYVKPSFVGPQQTEYQGNIYKLIQPLDEIGV